MVTKKATGWPEKVLLILFVFCLLFSAVLVVLPKPKAYLTALYFEENYYGKNRAGELFANFAIANRESTDFNYTISFFADSLNDNNSLDSVLLGKKNYFVKKGTSLFSFSSFPFPSQLAGKKNIRFRIQTEAFGETYSIHFWLRE